MKQIGFILACLLLFTGFYFYKHSNLSVTSPSVSKKTKTVTPTKPLTVPSVATSTATFLFVPYWTVGKEKIKSEHNLIYFGITTNQEGIDTQELGYKNIPSFLKLSEGNSKKLLAVRMVDSAINSKVLENEEAQKNIATQAATLAKESGFKGIVLDFEISSLSFDSVIKKITNFYSLFSKAASQSNLAFYSILYGDTFYRLRPYDVKTIASLSDSIFIMAYDFHKAREDPGPNFPLQGKEAFGYDFATMTSDFLTAVPKEKTIVVFGMFGYDWPVDANNKASASAQSISLNEANKKYAGKCLLTNCQVQRDQVSAETNVVYVDTNKQRHAVWFEDLESVKKKQEFLKQKGISSFGFWAYSYF